MKIIEEKLNELNDLLKTWGCSSDLSVVHGQDTTGNLWATISVNGTTVLRIEHDNERITNCSSPIEEINKTLNN